MKGIIYTRVSTKSQGKSGLGLKAQLSECKAFCEKENIEVVAHYEDIESGAIDERKGLMSAISLAKNIGGSVIVNKLDRLSRDLHFISGLVKHNVPFIVTQLGREVPTMVIYQYALWSQLEREMIGARIKAALAQSTKALGSANPIIKEASDRGRRAKGERTFERLWSHIIESMRRGASSYTEVQNYLDINGVLSSRGKRVSQGVISRAFKRARESGFHDESLIESPLYRYLLTVR